MDFVDSFTNLKERPLHSMVASFYESLNDFLEKGDPRFLHLWHHGEDAVLYFNLSERERGGDRVQKAFCQIRAVLSRVPVGTHLEATQVAFYQCDELAYAVTMEAARSQLNREMVVSEHRSTIVWRLVGEDWKVVHYHTDTYDRRTEVLSELLRSYHPDA